LGDELGFHDGGPGAPRSGELGNWLMKRITRGAWVSRVLDWVETGVWRVGYESIEWRRALSGNERERV
jgi:hypothetical protein